MIKDNKSYDILNELQKEFNKTSSTMKVGYVLYHTKIKNKTIVGEVFKERVINSYLNKTDEELDSILKKQFKTLNNFFVKTNGSYDISYVDPITNLDLWIMINNLPNKYIKQNSKSLTKYIKFCKKNKINQKSLSKMVGIDVPDIMKKLSIMERKCF